MLAESDVGPASATGSGFTSSRRAFYSSALGELASCLAATDSSRRASGATASHTQIHRLLSHLPPTPPADGAWHAHPRQLEVVLACCRLLAAARETDRHLWERLSALLRAWPRVVLLQTSSHELIDSYTRRILSELFRLEHAGAAHGLLALLHDMVHNICSAVSNIGKQPDPTSTVLIFYGTCRALEFVPDQLVAHVCEVLGGLCSVKKLPALVAEINTLIPPLPTKAGAGFKLQCLLLETMAQLAQRLEYVPNNKTGRNFVRVLSPPVVAGHLSRLSLNIDALYNTAMEFYLTFTTEFFSSSNQAPVLAASRNVTLDMRSMAACMLLAAATATTRDKAERVEAIINQTMEVTEPSLAMLSAYRAAIKSLEYLGQNFIGATVVATDALRRYLCEPSPLLCAMAVAGTAPGGAEHYAACELLCADAVSALAKLLRQSSAKQRNAGRIFVTSLPLPRPPAAGDTATQISHRLLYCNSVQLMTAVTEAVAAQEPDCATQAANLLYQRLHGGPSGCETETLLALARVGAAGPPVCFDSVLEMLLALALGMSHPPPSSSATAAATSSTVAGSASTSSLFPQPDSTTTALYRSLEKDDALVTAFQKLFTKARSTSIKQIHADKVLSLFNRVASETLAATDSLTQAQKHSERLLRLVQAVACVLSRVCRDAQADTEAGTAPASTTEEQDAYYDLQLYFWLHAVAFRLVGEHESPWPLAVQDAISTIAEASPVLVSPRAKQYFGELLATSMGHIEKKVTTRDVAAMQTSLINLVGKGTPIDAEVHRLSLAQTIYFHAVFRLEALRQQNSAASFLPCFAYITDPGIITDPDMAAVAAAVVETLFKQYVSRMQALRPGRVQQANCEDLAIFFLVNFNHRNQFVKLQADKLLSRLTDAFEHLLWSDRVIVAALDLLDLLAATVDPADPIATNVTIDLPYPPYVHIMPATREGREKIIADFAVRCHQLLDLALTRAPEDAAATIQSYISALIGRHLISQRHPGLNVALLTTANRQSSATAAAAATGTAAAPAAASATNAASAGSGAGSGLMSVFGPSLALRNHYTGQLEGVLLAAALAAGARTGTAKAIVSSETRAHAAAASVINSASASTSNAAQLRRGSHELMMHGNADYIVEEGKAPAVVGSPPRRRTSSINNAMALPQAGQAHQPQQHGHHVTFAPQVTDPSPFGQLPAPGPEQMMTPRAKGVHSSVLATAGSAAPTSTAAAGIVADGGISSVHSDAGSGSLVGSTLTSTTTGAGGGAGRRPNRVAQPDQVQGLVNWAEDVLFRLRALTRSLVKASAEQAAAASAANAAFAGTDPTTLKADEDAYVRLPAKVVEPNDPRLKPPSAGAAVAAAAAAAGAAVVISSPPAAGSAAATAPDTPGTPSLLAPLASRTRRLSRSYLEVLQQGQQLNEGSDTMDEECEVPLGHAVALFDEAMYQAAAVLAFRPPGWDPLSHTTSALYANLMEALVWAPVRVLDVSSMQTAVACWSWLMSASPDSETRMMHDMQHAWFWCIEQRRGLFSAQHGADEGPEAPLETPWRPAPSQSAAMELWIEYLRQRLAVVNQRSLSQAQLISTMVNHALLHADAWCRHPSTWTAKMRLCGVAVQLLHSSSLADHHHQLVLRVRLLDALLRDFSHPARTPHTCDLRGTIDAMFDLHNSLNRDRVQHCKRLDEELKRAVRTNSTSSVPNGLSVASAAAARRGTFGSTAMLAPARSSASTAAVGSAGGAGLTLASRMSSSRVNSGAADSRRGLTKSDSVVGAGGSELSGPMAQTLVMLGMNRLLRKCELVLLLLRDELCRLLTWYNPSAAPERIHPQEVALRGKKLPSENTFKEFMGLAWRVSPALAVLLAYRFPAVDSVQSEVRRLVRLQPTLVSHLPEALQFLLTKENVEKRAPELAHVLTWAPVSPPTALHLLGQFPGHPTVSQYCLRLLKTFKPGAILTYTPQLIQALRHDPKGYVAHYILEAANHSQLLAHQMIWNMKSNMFMDEEGLEKDPVLHDTLKSLLEQILDRMPPLGRKFYEREFSFFTDITGVSGRIRDKKLGPERDKACLEELAKIQLQRGCYLPSSPEGMVVAIDYKSAKPMQSAAKAPYLATFSVLPYGLEEMERRGQSIASGENDEDAEDEIHDPRVKVLSCLFKVGDDVRQDMLALQIMELFRNIYLGIGLDVALFPYRVVATAPGCGIIECVPNAKSRDQLGRATDASLSQYFLKIYGDVDSPAYQRARRNFIRSLAAYSVIGYLLQIKDRHNGNILISRDGAWIMIDFGFLFESSPGGNIGFEPDMKLTQEMVDIMGGTLDAEPYRWFVDQCIRAYLAVRPYTEQVVSLVAMMLESGFPCFRTPQVLAALRARFASNKTTTEAAAQMKKVIQHSAMNYRTGLYDKLQAYQNKIAY